MNLSIQAMEAADIYGVMELAASSPEAPQWTRRDYETVLTSALGAALLGACWVARQEQGLAGFVVARWLRGERAAEIEILLVKREYRRQGIATALVTACLKWADHAGAFAVRLEVRASNLAARTLYAGLGFIPIGERRAYYGSPVEDAHILEAQLPDGRSPL